MFIDLVDCDISLRLIAAGYKIIRLNHLLLDHELGKVKEARFLFTKVYVLNHNAIRKYYMSRNYIVLRKKGLVCFSFSFKEIVKLLLKTVIYEKDDKMKKIKSIFRGIKDGINFKTAKICDKCII